MAAIQNVQEIPAVIQNEYISVGCAFNNFNESPHIPWSSIKKTLKKKNNQDKVQKDVNVTITKAVFIK